jgi:putative tricarboxylic transport membrane protein
VLEAALTALGLILEPMRLAVLFAGVLIGLGIGVIPGLGGIVGMALLLPFTFGMDPYMAFAFLLGMGAVTTTSDTIPAVLFGVPGTTGSAATVLDGYPMAKRGEAGRAFGAAYSASLFGGVFGALLLAVSIPVLRPVILFLGSPELLAFAILGLSMVAALSGRTPLRGLAAAGFGILLAMIGADPQTATPRWTQGSLYLLDGLELVALTLGLFALPELVDMAIARRSIAGDSKVDTRKGQWEGVKDTFRHKWLVLRCGLIGAGLGAIPGLGSAVIDWIAYGHAARTEKGASETFGKGDVRGVLASEGSNNAKEGGALVPTIAFGVPGSASMAILLGAFLIHGLNPGPQMLSSKLDVTYAMVWSVALANVLGAGVCFLFSNQIARISTVRQPIIVPLILTIVVIGAYQGSRQWGDIYTLISFGVLGWVMKRLKWPRPPVILGFVLGGIIERFMFISTMRYGWEWMTRPLVMVVLMLAALAFVGPLWREWRAFRQTSAHWREWASPRLDAGTGFYLGLLVLLVLMYVQSLTWGTDHARLVPTLVMYFVVGAVVVSMLHYVFAAEQVAGAHPTRDALRVDLDGDFGDLPANTVARRALTTAGWIALLLVLIWVIGMLPAVFVFIVAYMRIEGGERWWLTLTVAITMTVACYVLFDQLLRVVWPATVLGQAVPALRAFVPSL